MIVFLDRKFVTVDEVVGEVFYDENLPTALRAAQKYSANGGNVSSLPQILHGRVVSPGDSDIWRNFFTALSEEDELKTPQGSEVIVTVHGGGIFGSPRRINRAYKEGLTNSYAGKISEGEARNVLSGKLPGGVSIPVYSFSDFKKGISDLPVKYAVVMDRDIAAKTVSGYQVIDGLYENALVIVRSGGIEPAKEYLDRVKEIYQTTKMGNHHPFAQRYSDLAAGRLLFVGGNDNDGLDGYYNLDDVGGFVGVAPKAQEVVGRVPPAGTNSQTPSLKTLVGIIRNPDLDRVGMEEALKALPQYKL